MEHVLGSLRSRPARLLSVLALACASAACVTSGTVERTGEDVNSLADKLVESARQRVELGQLRVVVRGITELRSTAVNARAAAAQPVREDPLGKMLEHELVIALSGRMNVVEAEIVARANPPVAASTLSDVATTFGATHLLVGTYQRGEQGLIVSVRLIDADSHVIVAAARGTVVIPERQEEERWTSSSRRWVIGETEGAVEAEGPEAEAVATVWPEETRTPPPLDQGFVRSAPAQPMMAAAAPQPDPVPPPAEPEPTLAAPEPTLAAREPTLAEPAVTTEVAQEEVFGPAWHWLNAVARRGN